MTRYDDESFLELSKDNENIMVEQMKQTTVRQQAAVSQTATHTVERATGDDAVDAEMPQAPPAPPPPPTPKFTQGSQTQHKLHTSASSQTFHHPPGMVTQGTQGGPGDQPPQPPAPAVAVTQDYTQQLRDQHEHNNAHMKHLQTNMERVADTMMAGFRQHLGPTVNLITQVMAPGTGGSSSSGPDYMDQSTGGPGPPKPPPGAGGTRIKAAALENKEPGDSPYGKAARVKTPRASMINPQEVKTGPKPPPQPPPALGLTLNKDTRKMPTESVSAGPTPKKVKAAAKALDIVGPAIAQKRTNAQDITGTEKKYKEAKQEVLAISDTTAQNAAPPKDKGSGTGKG